MLLLALLSTLFFGLCIIFLVPGRYTIFLKYFSLILSIFIFLFSLYLWVQFDPLEANFQHTFYYPWSTVYNITYSVGVDGISIFFVVLTTMLVPICFLSSWDNINYRVKGFVVVLLLTEFFLLNVFLTLDLLFFYIFFESVLIPMFLLIGIWGSRQRKVHAAYQFFLYTLVGSLVMLLGILSIYQHTNSTDIQWLFTLTFSSERQLFLWVSFFMSFFVKVPMFPVHIWLPEAHVEAPTVGSVILAGVLLKLGTYGFLRFLLPLFPYASFFFTPLVYMLSSLAIIYGACTTIRQIDFKKIIAYSSVVHMGYTTIGIFSSVYQGVQGSLFLMLGHGFVSSALFLCIGVLYDRYKTRTLRYYSSLTTMMPLLSSLLLFFSLANMSLPGTINFVGEFLILLGVFNDNVVVAILAGLGVVLSAIYGIWAYNRVAFGSLFTYVKSDRYQFLQLFCDLNKREFLVLLPLVFFTILFGIYPSLFFSTVDFSVYKILIHTL